MTKQFNVGDSVYRSCSESRYVYLVKSSPGVTECAVFEPKVRWKVIKIFEQFGKTYLQCKRMRKRGKQYVALKAEECYMHPTHAERMKHRQEVFGNYLAKL